MDIRDNLEEFGMPHLADLYRTAVRLIPDRTAAATCVEETYARAKASFGRRFERTNSRVRLFTILIDETRQYRRKHNSASQTFADSGVVGATGGFGDDELLLALDAVPDAYREAVLLCDVQEFSYKEASAILSASIDTVRSRVVLGREAWHEVLGARQQSLRFPQGCSNRPE